ncbi:kallikrein-6-like [Drosophila gunungcola]|uniref:kallikrein-6-like n=1 Tax=Drosophila gunungcola TaxID=103775 RepID=UPI0022E749A5|nr:kallikrein-6-like [Drosophila gunungcola]
MKVVAGIAVLICLFIEAEEGSAYLLESECGTKKQSDMGPKIKGGKDADPFSNPWMVRLIVESPICGGSLITCSFVLTAAHCVFNNTMRVRLGEYDTMNPENSYEIEADLKVVHQGYNYDPTTYKYDIGLLRLKSAVQFSDYVRPICLAVHEPIRPIIPFMIAGWGQSESGQSSNILQTAYVHLISQSICSHHYTRHVGRSQLCAYDQTSDACAGDSGGPLSAELQYRYRNQTFQLGIVSYGSQYCSSATVYTNVLHYMDWILGVLKEYGQRPAVQEIRYCTNGTKIDPNR